MKFIYNLIKELKIFLSFKNKEFILDLKFWGNLIKRVKNISTDPIKRIPVLFLEFSNNIW
jgi:hypothetical protein